MEFSQVPRRLYRGRGKSSGYFPEYDIIRGWGWGSHIFKFGVGCKVRKRYKRRKNIFCVHYNRRTMDHGCDPCPFMNIKMERFTVNEIAGVSRLTEDEKGRRQ